MNSQLLKPLFVIAIGTSIVILSIRVVTVASRTETGFETLWSLAKGATLNFCGLARKPISEMTPDEEARFWIESSRRIPEDHPDRLKIQRGAAVLLSSPPVHYKFDTTPGGSSSVDTIESSTRTVDDCRQRSLELARSVCQADPGNKEWWQIRALTLSIEQNDEVPFDQSVLDRLDEFSTYDRDNALYAFLSAEYLLDHCIEFMWDESPTRVRVLNQRQLERAEEYLDVAFQKPELNFSTNYYDDAHAFAQFCGGILDELAFQDSRTDRQFDGVYLVRNLGRVQRYRLETFVLDGDIEKAVELVRVARKIIEQFNRSNIRKSQRLFLVHESRGLYWTIDGAAQEHPELLSASGMEDIDELLVDAELDVAINQRARMDVNATVASSQPKPPVILLSAANLFPACIVVLVLVASVSGLYAFFFRGHNQPEIFSRRKIWPIGSLLFAFAISVVVCSLSPIHIISASVQRWSVTLLILAVVVSIPSFVAWRFLRGRRIRFSLKSLMVGTTLICLLISLATTLGLGVGLLKEIPFDVSFPEKQSDSIARAIQQAIIALPLPERLFITWSMWYGPAVMFATWCFLLLAFGPKRVTFQEDAPKVLLMRRVMQWIGYSVTRPLFLLAFVSLFAWLLIAPQMLLFQDRQIQDYLSNRRNIHNLVAARELELRSQPEEMKAFKDFAADEIKWEYASKEEREKDEANSQQDSNRD